MNNELNNILFLLEEFLGKSKNGIDDNTQIQFNCPCCSMEKGMEHGDGKYNLEVNIRKNIFKCWVCGETNNMSGKISKLIKEYGNNDILKRYRNELYQIRQSKLYEYRFNKDDFKDDEYNDNFIQFPKGFSSISIKDKNCAKAIEYLNNRGINDKIIKKFNIGYIKYDFKNKLSGRIIIPSYDSCGLLNYWVGRDFLNRENIVKYSNPKSDIIKKTDIVFNEGKINCYADITLVEGPFDHIVVPNSIPLLGKTIKPSYKIFDFLMKNAKSKINVFLDDDAEENAKKVYKELNVGNLKDNIRIINTPKGYDASLIYEKYGVKGIRSVLMSAYKLTDYELSSIS